MPQLFATGGGSGGGISQATADARYQRPFKWNSGFFYSTPAYGVTTRLCTDQELQAVPLFVPNAVTLIQIVMNVTGAGSAGSVLRAGIYNDNAGQPGSLLLDAGSVASATTGTKTITISQALGPGLFWLAAVAQGTPATNPTVQSINGGLALVGGPNPSAATYLRACYSDYGIGNAGLPANYGTLALDSGDFIYTQVKVQ